ncbi:pilus assembly protein TadG-related protein [Streptomyces sp. NBC_01142]|uniref:pilus assembly protein TadG-related protein n=1 Tax=Streptomyces sp. NBC_01142 TaxID=2975865 RepID=UPI002B1D7EF1|nr:pilus assembly protein TadG-related protein [Streptomyces sp. NBC_01142]
MRVQSDTGQATPLYMTAVVGLLFFALVYLAFGQADIRRNGTQTAADAAALAAAQGSRDELDLADFLDDLQGVLDGDVPWTAEGCREAARFAARNDARTGSLGCVRLTDGRWGFRVVAESEKSMGDSIIDGTENKHATAVATAVVEPRRCAFTPDEPDEPDESEAPPEGGDDQDPAEDDDKKPPLGKLVCDNQDWVIDPENLDLLPDMADLFTVRLAED